MPKALTWIGQNLSLGGLLRNSGTAVGETLNITCEALSYGLSLTPIDEKKIFKTQENLTQAGKFLASSMQKAGNSCGHLVDNVVISSSKAGERICEVVAQKSGFSDENTLVAKKFGSLIGALAVGVVAGGGLADTLIMGSAIAGTTGAAVTTSGLAGLAGGSLVSGGGGMVVGQAIAEGITAFAAASSLATLSGKEVNSQHTATEEDLNVSCNSAVTKTEKIRPQEFQETDDSSSIPNDKKSLNPPRDQKIDEMDLEKTNFDRIAPQPEDPYANASSTPTHDLKFEDLYCILQNCGPTTIDFRSLGGSPIVEIWASEKLTGKNKGQKIVRVQWGQSTSIIEKCTWDDPERFLERRHINFHRRLHSAIEAKLKAHKSIHAI